MSVNAVGRMSLKMIIVLGGVCLLSAAALGLIHKATYQRILENEKQRIREAIFQVIPNISNQQPFSYNEISQDPHVFVGSIDETILGYAIISSGMGFQGNISIMVGIDAQIENITAIKILDTRETPGLGGRIIEEEFLQQFVEMRIPADRKISVDSITAATISSQAVEYIVNKAIKNVESFR